MTNAWTLTGGEALLPDGFTDTDLHLSGGRIASDSADDAQTYHASGACILPGIVDLHGYRFESILQPRPGVHFPHALAYAEADAQMISNRISTSPYAHSVATHPGRP